MESSSYQLIQDLVIGITFIGGLFLYTRNRIPQRNVQQLTALTDTYEKRIASLETDVKGYHDTIIENARAIADLQGQIKVYKELPLRELADGIKKVGVSNEKILAVLQTTSNLSSEDIITNQDQHIKTEIHKVVDKDIKAKE